jgi:hypothetical protein
MKPAMIDSPVIKWLKSVKAWFGKKLSFKLPDFKTMWTTAKGGIGGFFTKIKTLFGKSAFFTELGKGVTRIKNMFTAGGPGLFAKLSGWLKSFKIPFPKWVTEIITKAKGLVGKGSFLGKMGSFFGKLFIWFQVITAIFDFWEGWTETKGNYWDKLWGGLSAALKGFINVFLDLGIMIEDGLKWIIKKIAGFFGFDEEKVAAAMGEFSIFKPLKEGFNAIVDWVVKLATNPLAAFDDLFGGVATVGLWIYNNALKPMWDWFEGMFPDAAAAIKPFFTGIASIGMWVYDNALKPMWTWIKGFFGGFLDIGIMIEDGFKWIITKVAGFFGFDEASIAASMADFSLFKPLKDGLFAVVDWLGTLLTNPLQAFEDLFASSVPNQSTTANSPSFSGLNREKSAIDAAIEASSNPKNPATFVMIHLNPSSIIIPISKNPPKNPLIQVHIGLSALSYTHIPILAIPVKNGLMAAAASGNIPSNQSHIGLRALL